MSHRQQFRSSLLKCALLAVAAALLLPACSRSSDTATTAREREYDVRGFIRGISAERTTLEIQHEAIGDFMPAMTMPFSVKDPATVQELNVGDAVSFRMKASTAQMWIESIRRIDATEVKLETPSSPPAATP